MLDLQKIDIHFIELFSEMYAHAAIHFGIEPINALGTKKRKIRKWISNTYIEEIHELPENLGDCFNVQTDAYELIDFLYKCYIEIRERGDDKKRRFEKITQDLSGDVKDALWKLLNFQLWPDMRYVGDSLEITIDFNPAFSQTLILSGLNAPVDYVGNEMLQSNLIFNSDENKFCFYGEIDDFIDDVTKPFAIKFSDAEIKTELFNSTENVYFDENPWNCLQSVCNAIVAKATLSEEYCNNAEKKLLPLIREIASLEFWDIYTPEQDYLTFKELKELSNRYRYKKITGLLEKLESAKLGSFKYYSIVRRLFAQLSLQKFEPLWREIFDNIKNSQISYQRRPEGCCEQSQVLKIRKQIEERMIEKGYVGTYPNFVKTTQMKKIHLVYSYNMSYFVGMEKRVRSEVQCCELIDEYGNLNLQFLCGTAFLKKGEDIKDIYSYTFNAKGRRIFSIVYYYLSSDEKEQPDLDDLDTTINIAVKKAECKRLNKEEKKEFYGTAIPGFDTFFWIFIIGGGLFATMMILAGIVISILAACAFGLFSEIPEMLAEVPWVWLFLFAWVGFGGAMGIIEVLAQRK